MGLIVHVDGGARGNPGLAGAGVTISTDDGTLIHEGAYYLGRQTNNAAEYHALIRALQRAQRCGQQTITVYSDSELLVRQITGEYRVKSPKLARLYEQVQLLLLRIPCWNIRHISRDENRRADELANLAIDRGLDVIVFEADPGQYTAPAAAGQAPTEAGGVSAPQPAGGQPQPPDESIGPTKPAVSGPSGDVTHAARVTLATAPKPGACPSPQPPCQSFTVDSTLPAGLCVHAAHALLPTILAVLNTEPAEFTAVPTLTVHCMYPGCGATFHVSPMRKTNGAARRNDSPSNT